MQEEIADPNRPKRPRPAYFIFSTEKMAELRAKDGEGATQSGAAYAKLVGALWRDMGDDQKVRGDPSATNPLNCCCWLAFTLSVYWRHTAKSLSSFSQPTHSMLASEKMNFKDPKTTVSFPRKTASGRAACTGAASRTSL